MRASTTSVVSAVAQPHRDEARAIAQRTRGGHGGVRTRPDEALKHRAPCTQTQRWRGVHSVGDRPTAAAKIDDLDDGQQWACALHHLLDDLAIELEHDVGRLQVEVRELELVDKRKAGGDLGAKDHCRLGRHWPRRELVHVESGFWREGSKREVT